MPKITLKNLHGSGSGSASTVFAAFLHFDMCFTIWVLLGALSVPISANLGLNAAQQTLMVAVPTLSGSLMRIPMGLLSDRLGGRRVGIGMLLFLCLPLLAGWLVNGSLPTILCIGLLLGTAGASFSVALPLASRWYPPEKQGLVMGIAAAGNIGVVFANLIAPSLARAYGWHVVMGVTLIPLAIVLLVFSLLAKENPERKPVEAWSRYVQALKQSDLWWFCLLYSLTFGGFVGLGSFLPLFFHNQYHMNAVNAGLLNALATFIGSSLRPLGGYIADRIGGVRALTLFLLIIAVMYAVAALLLPLLWMGAIIIVGVACLGMGNGAVFQLVPQRFREEIGVVTGIVGAFGGVGGFLLPILLGSVKQGSGSYAIGWIVLAFFACTVLLILRLLVVFRSGWRFSWVASSTSAV